MEDKSQLTKRTECYIQAPINFSIAGCPRCKDIKAVEWSEYEDHLWCPTCEIDFIPEHWGLFDGPISVNVCELMGISFDKFRFTDNQYLKWDTEKGDWIESLDLPYYEGLK